MTPPKLDMEQAKAICEAATEGPWTTALPHDDRNTGAVYMVKPPHDWAQRCVAITDYDTMVRHNSYQADATFIAYARQALPAALDEVERLRGLVMEACDLAVSFNVDGPQPGEKARVLEIRQEARR